MVKLTDDRRKVLEALVRGDKVHGRSANELYPATAGITRKGGRWKFKIRPSVIEALYRADLIDKQWEGLGNWTAIITPAGRAALSEQKEERG